MALKESVYTSEAVRFMWNIIVPISASLLMRLVRILDPRTLQGYQTVVGFAAWLDVLAELLAHLHPLLVIELVDGFTGQHRARAQ